MAKTDAELKQDIDYIFHSEHELPMEWYTQLEATKADLVKCMQIHIDAEVKAATTALKYKIGSDLKEHIGGIVLSAVEEDHNAW